jgi:hypothetical protein
MYFWTWPISTTWQVAEYARSIQVKEPVRSKNTVFKQPWIKRKLVGQKLPLKLKEIWAIRVRLQIADKRRDLALFNLAIDSKLRGSDLVKLMVSDVANAGVVASRAMVMQRKAG